MPNSARYCALFWLYKNILIRVQNIRFCRFVNRTIELFKNKYLPKFMLIHIVHIIFKVLKIFKNITFIYYSTNRSDDYNKRTGR